MTTVCHVLVVTGILIAVVAVDARGYRTRLSFLELLRASTTSSSGATFSA